MRLALVGLLALAWAGSAPAGFSVDPHHPAPIGFERSDVDQAILTQRLSGGVVFRAAGPDGGQITQSAESHPAIPPAELSLPVLSERGVPASSTARAPAGWTARGYNARAPPTA